jgi:nicotinamidase-related amidase
MFMAKADKVSKALKDLVQHQKKLAPFDMRNLDMLLRSNGIKSVVMTGGTTEGCVESTARDALFNDYYVVIAEDCVASDDRRQHEASLLLMRHRFDIATAEEILGIWSAQEDGRGSRADSAMGSGS